MRTLSAMVAALSLGGCAAQPLALADMAAQIRSDFPAGKQSCAGQENCFHPNPVAQSKPGVQAAERHAKQRIVDVNPLDFNALEPARPPKPEGARETFAEGVPTLNSEASCHPTENLAVDQNVDRCLSAESSARDQLAHKWAEFPSADRSHCARYTTSGGGGTYTDLLTCLEMDLDARNLNTKNRTAADQ